MNTDKWEELAQAIGILERSGHPFNERIRLMGALVRAQTVGGCSIRNMNAIERSMEAGKRNMERFPNTTNPFNRDHSDEPPDVGGSRYRFDEDLRSLRKAGLPKNVYRSLYSVLWLVHEGLISQVSVHDYAGLSWALAKGRVFDPLVDGARMRIEDAEPGQFVIEVHGGIVMEVLEVDREGIRVFCGWTFDGKECHAYCAPSNLILTEVTRVDLGTSCQLAPLPTAPKFQDSHPCQSISQKNQ
jgi:hypothetical protein